jgi:hypothetical protein
MVYDYVGVYDYFKELGFEDKDNVLSEEDMQKLITKKLKLVSDNPE